MNGEQLRGICLAYTVRAFRDYEGALDNARVTSKILNAAHRIVTVGQDQYATIEVDPETGNEIVRQTFEDMPFADLVACADEEVLDLLNYLAMIEHRITRSDIPSVTKTRLMWFVNESRQRAFVIADQLSALEEQEEVSDVCRLP